MMIKFNILILGLFIACYVSFGQELKFYNEKGRTLLKIEETDYLRLKLSNSPLSIPVKSLDSIVEFKKNNKIISQSLCDLSKLGDTLIINHLSGNVYKIGKDYLEFDNMMFYPGENRVTKFDYYFDTYYQIYFTNNSTYPKIPIDNLRLIETSQGFKSLWPILFGSIGLVGAITSPLYSIDYKNKKFIKERFFYCAGIGLSVYLTGLIISSKTVDSYIHYSTNRDDIMKLGKKYRYVKLKIE